MLSLDLPSLSQQKRREYKTNKEEVINIYIQLNKQVFNSELILPEIVLLKKPKKYFGECKAIDFVPIYTDRSNCIICLSTNWICQQWLVMILAHEMCHQYQWDIESIERIKNKRKPILSHGPTFFKFRSRLNELGIPLKKLYSVDKWLKTQNLFTV